MKLIINTKSYLLAGSGEAQALVDTDAVFDNMGLPYIPAKRMKGLLRESALEIQELTGKFNPLLLNSIFGSKGNSVSGISFDNFYLKGSQTLANEIKNINLNLKTLLSPDKIRRYFSVEVQQNSMEVGVTKQTSLRNYRVVKKTNSFEASIDGDLSEQQKAMLYLAAINLKHIGTRRNRGFGLIDIKVENSGFTTIQEAYKLLSEPLEREIKERIQSNNYSNITLKATHFIAYTIKTLSPVIIGKQRGEQNTVASADFIPGIAIRGMLAEKIFEKYGLSTDKAHEDPFFFDAILNSSVKIKDAYPVHNNSIFYPSSLALQKAKGIVATTIYNVLNSRPDAITRPIGGRLNIKTGGYERSEVLKSFNFHNSRTDNRLAGKSIKDGIFYYESIDRDQLFSGRICGSEILLDAILNLNGESFNTRLGRSKTSQYGSVQISFGPIEAIVSTTEEPTIGEETLLLSFTSPAIFYNENGFSNPSLTNLENYLKEFFKDSAEIKPIEKFISLFGRVENYLGTWRCKTPAESSFSEGTTFKLDLKIIDPEKYKIMKALLLDLGIGERTHEGYGSLVIVEDSPSFNFKPDDKTTTGQIVPATLKNAELRKILEKGYTELRSQYIKMSAIKNSKSLGKDKLTNHLASRLEDMLGKAKNIADWNTNYMKHLDNKQAGETLKKRKLWEKLKTWNEQKMVLENTVLENIAQNLFTLGIQELKIDEYAEFKMYWKTFFRNIRKLNNM